MMMESPVGTTYELCILALVTVSPHVSGDADPCGALSAAEIADEAARGHAGFRAGFGGGSFRRLNSLGS